MRCMIILGTKSRNVLVTIRMYESTKLRIVSTCLSNAGSRLVTPPVPRSDRLPDSLSLSPFSLLIELADDFSG